jgi:hypothetical protein
VAHYLPAAGRDLFPFLFLSMKTTSDIVALHNLGGECGDKAYVGNQYGRYVLTPLWTTEQWEGSRQGAIEITYILSELWATMTQEEKNSWAVVANRNRFSNYCAFIRFNYPKVKQGLEPLKSPT